VSPDDLARCRFTGLRLRLAAAFFSLGVLPLLFLGGMLLWLTYQIQLDRVHDHQRALLARMRIETAHFLDGFVERLRRFNLLRDFSALAVNEQRQALAILLAERREFREIALIGVDGREHVRVAAAQPLFDEDLRQRGDDAGFRWAMERLHPWVSHTYHDEATGEPLMMLMIPLVDRRSGRSSSVLAAEVRLRTLWYLMARADLLTGESVYLLDEEGRVIAHANPSHVLRGDRLDAPTSGRTVGLDGDDVFRQTSTLAFAQRQLTLVTEQQTGIALEPARRALVWMLAALLVALAMVTLLFWVAARRIVQPVEDIAAVARAVRAGHLDARAPGEGRRDEIGDLAASFNAMTAELAALLAEKQCFSDELAARIEERTAQLKQANDELESFAYSVSHDLRAPLRAIDGFSRIVVEDYGDTLDAEGQRLLGIVRNNALRMQQLIEDILHFSRLGRTAMQDASIDMKAMVAEVWAEVLASVQAGAARRKIEFILGDLPPAHGDRAMVRQIWANLLGNAAKFTQKREQARIEVRGRREGALNVYEVEDNGAGFDPDYADKLFGIFQRLHSAQEYEGTGIGLALVERIVTRHGGRVWARGEIDRGACFGFTLPADTESQPGGDGA